MHTMPVAGMTAETARAKPRSAPLDPQTADRLLDLLSTDDAFRRLFKKNPAAALAKLGHELPASGAACFFVQTLTSKANIALAREAIKNDLMAGLTMTPVQLNASTAAQNARLRKK